MKGKNSIVITIVVAFLVGAGAFYSGIQYQKTQRGTFGGRNAGVQQGRAFGNAQGTRPINGEIISQDDKSITVKMQDGSSKIIILSEKTAINKATASAKTDLKTGERVTAFGTANSDGSITAQSISIGSGMFQGRPTVTQAK